MEERKKILVSQDQVHFTILRQWRRVHNLLTHRELYTSSDNSPGHWSRLHQEHQENKMFCQLLLLIMDGFDPNRRVLCSNERGRRDRDTPRGIGTVGPAAVTSRSTGLGSRCHSLLLLSLAHMRPVHISLDLQGIGCTYDRL